MYINDLSLSLQPLPLKRSKAGIFDENDYDRIYEYNIKSNIHLPRSQNIIINPVQNHKQYSIQNKKKNGGYIVVSKYNKQFSV